MLQGTQIHRVLTWHGQYTACFLLAQCMHPTQSTELPPSSGKMDIYNDADYAFLRFLSTSHTARTGKASSPELCTQCTAQNKALAFFHKEYPAGMEYLRHRLRGLFPVSCSRGVTTHTVAQGIGLP